jgi:molybdenum cofactor cytidylyltransferase
MNSPILLLAAGASLRMGTSKQLLVVDGEPLLLRSVHAALEVSSDVTVVLGANAHAHRVVLGDLPIRIVDHPGWELGMGSSLKAGLKAIVATNPSATEVLVMLCDQPKVGGAHLKTILKEASRSDHEIIASRYQNTLGVPSLFKASVFSDLLGLADEAGASKLIRSHPEKVEAVDFPDGAIDLDTPDDVTRYTTKLS